MRLLPAALACAALWAGTAAAQTPECRADAQGQIDLQACAEAAPRGSPERQLALINLGTQAVMAQDYAGAVRFYDEARPSKPGEKLFSDPSFHSFRAIAYDRVGRKAEALEDARTALTMLGDERWKAMGNAEANDPEIVLQGVLPILKRAGDRGYPAALATYRGLPARDWISHANRAGVLMELEDYPGAEAANAEAMRSEPNHPAILNNACYLLTKTGRAAEGLAFCVRAVETAPEIAAIHDSYATALAALGRCDQAEAELAKARQLDTASVEYRRKLDCKAG